MGWPRRGTLPRWRSVPRAGIATVALSAIAAATAAACSGPAPPSARDQHWRQDIAYLARELPLVRTGGLGPVAKPAWDDAAAQLEAEVPKLSDGQVVVGLARLVAMVRDDETQLRFPPGPVFGLQAQWVGGSLDLVAVPAADRSLLGARLLAVDGHPVAQVLARAGTVIGGEDAQLRSDSEIGVLDDAALLRWLGVAASTAEEDLSVTTTDGKRQTARIKSSGSAFISLPVLLADALPGLVQPPAPLYEQNAEQPYWMRVLPAQHAVYLKYNQCLPDSGFQRLAAQALTLLKAHRDYRLIVDLRDNLGGSDAPFASLIAGIGASPALSAPGRVIGLVNQFTDSAATVDAQSLKQAGAVLIGQSPADPVDAWGDEQAFTLPRSGIVVQYTTAAANPGPGLLGIPHIAVEPTLAEILRGADPVLAAAVSYRPAGAQHP